MPKTGRPIKDVKLSETFRARVTPETYNYLSQLSPTARRQMLEIMAQLLARTDLAARIDNLEKMGYSEKQIDEEKDRTVLGYLQLLEMGKNID